jgi:hypothetical protein
VDLDPSASGASPVVNISWLDVIDVCNQFSDKHGLRRAYSCDAQSGEVTCDWGSNGYRLPTEAEWQYACKAGTSGYRYGEIDVIAWYAANSEGRIHDVGGKAPNPWGLYDMLGQRLGVVLGPVRRGGLRLLSGFPWRRLGRADAGLWSFRASPQPPVVRDRRSRLPARSDCVMSSDCVMTSECSYSMSPRKLSTRCVSNAAALLS